MPDTSTDPDDGLPVWQAEPGDALIDGHLALERLGVGLRCETWLAWSVPLWSPAVVKLARPHQVAHPRAQASLGREVSALGTTSHPGLPRLYVDGRGHRIPHLVLEYVDGPALDEEIDERPLTDAETCLLGAHLLSTLRAVHDAGVVHVDLKPENVLLRHGSPVLVDFGSARPIGAEQPAGRPIGTAGYAAPELERAGALSTAVDLYGLGTVLYEALTGEPAFDPHVAAAERPIPSLPPAVEPSLSAVVLALLAAEPAGRCAPDRAMAVFAAGAARVDRRPWPVIVDRHLRSRFAGAVSERLAEELLTPSTH